MNKARDFSAKLPGGRGLWPIQPRAGTWMAGPWWTGCGAGCTGPLWTRPSEWGAALGESGGPSGAARGGAMDARRELAIAANQGTAEQGKGTGALCAVRWVQSAR